MPVTIGWGAICLRLSMTILAGLLVGFNRGEHGRPAGLRTTLLVCLAASLSMIQANLLLNSIGRASDSFVMLDVMRLPLGVLSGMGFIGAGTILRRGDLVTGVTTAATLWFVTVMGLCFGGGQIGLGLLALGLALATLWGLKRVEEAFPRESTATIELIISGEELADDEIRRQIQNGGGKIIAWAVAFSQQGKRRDVQCELRVRNSAKESRPPAFVAELANNPLITELRWQPQGLRFAAGSET